MANPKWYCKNHPNRIGFVDLGKDADNRYPCRECYLEIIKFRKTGKKTKWTHIYNWACVFRDPAAATRWHC